MHALIVHCHPEPQSFNAALKNVATETLQRLGYTVEVSDLYAEGFDPAEGPTHYREPANTEIFTALTEQRHASEFRSLPTDVCREIERLERADLVVFQFPLWWHAQPAMLKGWMDRVFVYGGLYTGTYRYDRGHFRGRRAICCVTTGGPAATFAHNGRGGDINLLLWPMHYSLYYMGYDVLPPFLAHGIQGGGPVYQARDTFKAQLETYKAGWARRLETLAENTPIPFTGWNDWDERGVLKPGVEGYDYFIRAHP
ncbi:NAD(P)H-dependent oxidoreductase [Halomonas sp. PR-M31]|uniref:NAD(P)H-dependent oxidoreductase n=1 Tax=Halomonas sp. PR-M31 TaxID=1471202 RepID=UPI000650FB59|nr:NAD(P)H-dependent oxidoreductase [Halomonas sp. PR-M31]